MSISKRPSKSSFAPFPKVAVLVHTGREPLRTEAVDPVCVARLLALVWCDLQGGVHSPEAGVLAEHGGEAALQQAIRSEGLQGEVRVLHAQVGLRQPLPHTHTHRHISLLSNPGRAWQNEDLLCVLSILTTGRTAMEEKDDVCQLAWVNNRRAPVGVGMDCLVPGPLLNRPG